MSEDKTNEDKTNEDKMKKPREEVYHYAKGRAGSFTTGLLDLFGKADMENTIRLSTGFPLLCQAVREWQSCENVEDYFEKYVKESE